MHQQWFTSGSGASGDDHWERVDDDTAPDPWLEAAEARLEWDRRQHHRRHDEWPHWGWGWKQWSTHSRDEEDHRGHEGDGWGRRSDAGSDGSRGFGTPDQVRKIVTRTSA